VKGLARRELEGTRAIAGDCAVRSAEVRDPQFPMTLNPGLSDHISKEKNCSRVSGRTLI
jgi:hypothetical protein